ncbi:recombinase family protein [Nostoc sp. UCD121]|uniref:recombinase family protein n=1 Tax=unclassified Nostoc TaxID=2593658 RepID=UPI00162456EB|nr:MULTISPECIES: recombinase family protein [unclassified Nostoc]MBC1224679.1 recombinase family protein [Nostoc sp. UCD120]MBC1275706.1 recombinase family protein [Nostoc sp. UCD121]MBC1295355.1 recombinase family protein [Nostoc sp. UCD122]
MVSHSVWIVGTSRTGKTARLVEQFCSWVQPEKQHTELFYTNKQARKKGERIPEFLYLKQTEPGVLVLAANDDNRRELGDIIVTSTLGKYPVRAKTPLGFFQDEVILFWPLLINSLNLKAQFPVRLRPETEQELATKLWRSQLNEEILRVAGVNESRLVRRILDLLQLAAYSGVHCEDIAQILTRGLGENTTTLEPEFLASLLIDWRNWCLERGLLTYGIITELYSQYLLSDRNYQQHLTKRYQAVLADDVDDYPSVARLLFELLLDQGAIGAFSYNPDGAVRLGLGADPKYLEGLAKRCRVEILSEPPPESLGEQAKQMVELVTEPMVLVSLPEIVHSIQTTSRAQLLRQTAEVIADAIQSQQVQAEEVAIIAPGLDAIARYTLVEILVKQNIQVESLNDQRPLISSPVIRALLTMLALVYPGLGRLVDRDAVAEMLVVLSRKQQLPENSTDAIHSISSRDAMNRVSTNIDPVRAGLIADYCFVPHPDRPNLLPVSAFERWDRIGYAATTAYNEILEWLEQQRSQQELRLIPSPISLLDRAIQRFLWNGSNLPYEQLAALRELLETAQHYWEIDTRLRQIAPVETTPHTTIIEFIQLLRRGTITANPYPVRPIGGARKSVTLATIFQYRSSRRSHRWHFWLDAGSPLWAKGGAATLFGAPFFLQDRLGEPWTAEDEKLAEEERLRRILTDLLSRVSERVYLCHSDLAVNGQEQLGPLLPLVNACVTVISEAK